MAVDIIARGMAATAINSVSGGSCSDDGCLLDEDVATDAETEEVLDEAFNPTDDTNETNSNVVTASEVDEVLSEVFGS